MRQMILVCFAFFAASALAGPFSEFAVSPSIFIQENPAVDGDTVVWQEDFGDESASEWNILGMDINDSPGNEFIFGYTEYNETNPAVSGNKIVWQLDYSPTDHDIYFGDILTGSQGPVSETNYDEMYPAIHGNLVVWQERYEDEVETTDWNIYSADILNPADPNIQPVSIYVEDQISPAVFRSDVVFADFYIEGEAEGSFDITVTDTWMRDNPIDSYPTFEPEDEVAPAIDGDRIVYQHDYSGNQTDYDLYVIDRSDPRVNIISLISGLETSEEQPDISGHIVVWQDYRNNNWDIYGYNLVTQQEFQITDDPFNQQFPAISGNLVVWQDERDEISQTYAAYLTDAVMANCDVPLAGDTDGNCRVDLADFVLVADNWLSCTLMPASACGE